MSCLYSLVIVNDALMNTFVQVLPKYLLSILLGIRSGVERIVEHIVCYVVILCLSY